MTSGLPVACDVDVSLGFKAEVVGSALGRRLPELAFNSHVTDEATTRTPTPLIAMNSARLRRPRKLRLKFLVICGGSVPGLNLTRLSPMKEETGHDGERASALQGRHRDQHPSSS
ncbi:MAG TPA: hypothetical protein VMV14_08350 [Acidimicrobiales bacterium]|nr:hypothetical protein [Acidimicrobiales bacterium]